VDKSVFVLFWELLFAVSYSMGVTKYVWRLWRHTWHFFDTQ